MGGLTRTIENFGSVGCPAHHDPFRTHPLRSVQPRVKGPPSRFSPLGGHDIDILVTVVLASEGDLLSIRREPGEKLQSFRIGELSRLSPGYRNGPDIPPIDKSDLVSVNCGKTHEAGLLR